MARSIDSELNSLRLTAQEVKEQNPSWSDEMIRDYIARQEDLQAIAEEVSRIIYPMILANLSQRDKAAVLMQQEKASALEQVAQNIQAIQNLQISQAQQISIARTSTQKPKGYAKLTRSIFNESIPAGTEALVDSMTGQGSVFNYTDSSITLKSQQIVSVDVYFEAFVESDTQTSLIIKKNGANYEVVNFLVMGGIERQPFSISFADIGNRNDVYELYFSNPTAVDLQFDVANIVFSLRG